ncbi:MAG: Crp/Fnr family transcriptional regulator [Flavobacteriales bacterium]
MRLSFDEFDISFSEISKMLFTVSPTLDVDFFLEIFEKGKIIKLKKETILYKESSHNKKLYLILDGYVRLLKSNKNGDNKTLFIFEKHQTFFCIHSNILKKPSIDSAECLTDCVLFEIDYTSLEKKMISSPKTSKIFVDNIFKFIHNTFEHINQLTLLTYEERFHWLIENKKDFFKDLKNKHIADFLGISPASLGRIKRKYYNKH